MPAEDFLRVIDQSVTPHVDPHKVLIIISGGEPLMRKDLAQVGAALKQRGYPWGMVTNGLALTPKRFKELMQNGLRSMAISFDAYNISLPSASLQPELRLQANNGIGLVCTF
jgi:molybdenum cofactor biosynthesis enzyme MoaA